MAHIVPDRRRNTATLPIIGIQEAEVGALECFTKRFSGWKYRTGGSKKQGEKRVERKRIKGVFRCPTEAEMKKYLDWSKKIFYTSQLIDNQ